MIGVLLLLAMGNWPTRGLAFVDTTASWRFFGDAHVRHNPSPVSFKVEALDDQGASMTLGHVKKPIFLNVASDIFKGHAYVVGKLEATAGIGHLSVDLGLDLYAENDLAGVPLDGIATALVNVARATASWRDSATISVPGLPQGFPLLVPAGYQATGGIGTTFPDTLATSCCGEGYTELKLKFIDGTLFEFGTSLHHSPAQDVDGDIDFALEDYLLLPFKNGIPRDIGFILEATASGQANRGNQFLPRSTSRPV